VWQAPPLDCVYLSCGWGRLSHGLQPCPKPQTRPQGPKHKKRYPHPHPIGAASVAEGRKVHTKPHAARPVLGHRCRELMEALADVVREHPRLLVLSDEIYEYITYA